MNDRLKIETILGYVANDNPLRASRDGKTFEGMIPAPAWTEVTTMRNGSVTDTVNEMRKIINHNYWQAAKVAQVLKGKDLYETCHNIWNFLFYHIRYNEDSPGKEELRTFARTFAQRFTGVDCDDFSLAAGSILKCLNVNFYIRIARYEGKDYFQHVYVVVPLQDKEYITIDGVLDEYDAEKPPVETKDFLVMSNKNLNGIDISVLGGVDDDTLHEISGILSGADFKEVNELEGLGTLATEEQELGAIRNYLIRTRNLVKKRPEFVSDTEHPESFLGMVDYALKYWDTEKRDEALGVLEGEENRLNELEGMSGFLEGHEDVDLFYGLNDDGSYNVLGKAKKQRKFFAKVKQAAKKAGKGIKKIAKALVRFNPLTVTIRAAVLLALKVNLFKVSTKLKWGYLTQEEAVKNGFDMAEWQKVKSQLAKAENLFVNTLQGKAENFKRAILTGRAGKLSGTDLGLGVVATAAAAASTTAAVPFITKIINLLKNINFKKLVAKVKPALLKVGKKKAENDTPTEDGESAMPEGGEASDGPTDSPTPESNASESEGGEQKNESTENTDNAETTNGNKDVSTSQSGKKTIITSNPPSENPNEQTETPTAENSSNSTAENSNPENLPAARGSNLPAAKEDATTQVSVFTKAVDWVKENKGTTVIIGVSAALVLYGLLSPKPKHALSGVRRGKKRKGKNKKNPPHSISGTGRKNRKGGKGGNKKFKL